MAAFTGNSIVGQVIAGDGHVVSSGQHGVVNGVTSAQAFGTTTVKQTYNVAVVGIGSAQSFGSVTISAKITKLVGGVFSAQQFGAPAAKPPTALVPVGGVTSAQSFGTLTLHWSQIVQVPGLPQQSGIRSIVGGVISGDGHLVGGTGFLFGFVTIIPGRVTVSFATLGLQSAQQFGRVTITWPQFIPVAGVPSGQLFGLPFVANVLPVSVCTPLTTVTVGCVSLTAATVGCGSVTVTTLADTVLTSTPASCVPLILVDADV